MIARSRIGRSCDGGFQCATARVPLSYRDPRGATISIAVVRHLATDPARRAGTLFINSGGPTEQIDGFVTGGFEELPAAITARRDIIMFDPRGFGYSTAVRSFPTMAAESRFLGDLSYGDPPVFPVGARQDAARIRTWPGSTRGAPRATAACSTMTPPPMWPVT